MRTKLASRQVVIIKERTNQYGCNMCEWHHNFPDPKEAKETFRFHNIAEHSGAAKITQFLAVK